MAETNLEYARRERQAATENLQRLTKNPLATENEIHMARLILEYWKKSVQYQKQKETK